MKTSAMFKFATILLATIGLVLPNWAFGAAMPVIQDVALQSGGTFNGQIVDAQGTPVAGSTVLIQQDGQILARTTTAADGQFSFTGLRGGVYRVDTPAGSGIYRAWAPQTAPPNANQAIMLTADDTVRAQGGGLGFLANPWVIAAAVAVAIAVPVAVSQRSGS